MTCMAHYDAILVGGGLANCLIAWRLHQMRPELSILILEQGPAIGGNHTWSFYETDVTPAQRQWLAPLIAHSWPGYGVCFESYTRRLATPYHSLTSDRLRASIIACPSVMVIEGATVTDLLADSVALDDGCRFTAPLVIDGRGYAPTDSLVLRWQKFVGLEAIVIQHGMTEPIIMDASVTQHDGYRFVYILPLAPDRLLIEDTYYADASALDPAAIEAAIIDYVHRRGWQMEAIVRREQGVLPITLAGDIQKFWREKPQGLPVSGLAAGLFHPVTGYSLPSAIALAGLIAAQARLTSDHVNHVLRSHAHESWRRQRFLRLLNRMLFLAGRSHDRHRVLARFYRLPQDLIERFYGDRLRLRDKLRLLMGKPPVPVLQAIKAMFSRGNR